MGSNFVAQHRVAQCGEACAVVISSGTLSTQTTQPVWQFVRPRICVVAQQGEVSADSAWHSENFVAKGFTEGALKARQLQPGLFSVQGNNRTTTI